RRVRTIAMNKLRGFSVPTKRGIFSLDQARFSILPNGLRQPTVNAHPNPLQPVPHRSAAFSLGSKDMDRMLGGSIPRGSFLLFDVDSSVSQPVRRMGGHRRQGENSGVQPVPRSEEMEACNEKQSLG